MADIAVTPRQVAAVTDTKPHMKLYIAGESFIEQGTLCRLNGNGVIVPSTGAATSGVDTLAGVALGPANPGETVSLLWDGSLSGYDLAGLPFGTPLYAADALGAFSTTPGIIPTKVGIVLPLTDRPATRVLYVQVALVPYPEPQA